MTYTVPSGTLNLTQPTIIQQQQQHVTEMCVDLSVHIDINPLKPSVIIRSHFECSAPYRPNLPFLISDIRALWHSGLSARVPECRKLKTVG